MQAQLHDAVAIAAVAAALMLLVFSVAAPGALVLNGEPPPYVEAS